MNRKRKRMLRKKAPIAAAAVLLLLAVVVLIGSWEKRAYTVEEPQGSVVEIEPILQDPVIIQKDGLLYRQKPYVETYLFMGVDTSGKAEESESHFRSGQADVQMVLVVDHSAQSWQLLQLNRDSMVEVPVLSLWGNVVGWQTQQLALAHAFGDGLELSCENNVRAVSRLMWDQPIDGYYALNMDAVGLLNDFVGGVTVTVTDDFRAADASLKLGETLRLNGEQAVTFVRGRKTVADGTNINRMGRQKQYMASFIERCRAMDETEAEEALRMAEAYTVSDMSRVQMIRMLVRLRGYEQKEMLTVDGYNDLSGSFAEYYLDEKDLQGVLLSLFYEPWVEDR